MKSRKEARPSFSFLLSLLHPRKRWILKRRKDVVQHRAVASGLKTSAPSYIRQKARQPVVVEGEVQVAIRVRPDPGKSTGEHDDEGEPSNSIPRENVVSGVNANYPEKSLNADPWESSLLLLHSITRKQSCERGAPEGKSSSGESLRGEELSSALQRQRPGARRA